MPWKKINVRFLNHQRFASLVLIHADVDWQFTLPPCSTFETTSASKNLVHHNSEAGARGSGQIDGIHQAVVLPYQHLPLS